MNDKNNFNNSNINIIKEYYRRSKVIYILYIIQLSKFQLEILKTLPDSIYFDINDPNSIFKEEDLEKIYELIDNSRNGKSFIKEINDKSEFKNPEYLQVIILLKLIRYRKS